MIPTVKMAPKEPFQKFWNQHFMKYLSYFGELAKYLNETDVYCYIEYM